MHCPQSPKPSSLPPHVYPSPRSKSPPPGHASKLSWKWHGVRYPFADITNSTIASAAPDIPPATLCLDSEEPAGGPEPPHKLQFDMLAQSGKDKYSRERPKGPPPRDSGLRGGGPLRSPIPLTSLSPRSFPRVSINFRLPVPEFALPSSDSSIPSSLTPYPSDAPEPRTPPQALFTPETAAKTTKDTIKRAQHRLSAIIRSPPPSPRPAPRRSFRARNYFTRGSPPRSDSPPHTKQPHLTYSMSEGQQASPTQFPAFLDPRETQDRKKRTKRELAELQWQITVHRSLAWRIRTARNNGDVLDEGWGECLDEQEEAVKSERVREALGLGQGGLMIAFEPMECGHHEEDRVKDTEAGSHWTDLLERVLVKRLWDKLVAQGCASVIRPTCVPVSVTDTVPFPTIDPCPSHPPGISFPSGDSESQDTLAPAIQLAPSSGLSCGRRSGPRRRLSAIASRTDSRPVLDVSTFPRPPISCPVPTSPPLPVSNGRSFPTVLPPKGTLIPAQLVAQTVLRRGHARAKPIKRLKTQSRELKRSGLEFVITLEN